MGKRAIPPAIRRLIVHGLECGGAWLLGDPVKFNRQTLEAACARGLVRLEIMGGVIVTAIVTEAGREAMNWGSR